MAIEIFEICTLNDIRLYPTWIPRELNQDADYLSKFKDSDDWSIDKATFNYICKEFGTPTVDRFADNLNTKLDVFNSKFYCPGTSAVNSFTQDWSHASLNWLCPPIKFILATIEHLRRCKAKGILLIPQWPSSHYWPLIHNGTSFNKYIKRFLIVNPFFASKCDNVIFKGYAKFNSLALLIEF